MRWRHENLEVAAGSTQSVLPFGNGRSYGDVCLNGGGILLDTRGLDRIIQFDARTGTLTCEAGVLFSEILELITPHGWFLPVTPGTQFVTVGGAIANDVHGKNHHRAGSFGCHVVRFELLRSDGGRSVCSLTENRELFKATIGGLGLTGMITWAEFQLLRVPSAAVAIETIPFVGVDEFAALSAESADTHEYTVAWVDCLAGGKQFARGLFTRGNHVEAPSRAKPSRSLAAVPFTPPFSLVTPFVVRAFNAGYFRAGAHRRRQRVVPYEAFFYPLDAIRHWNRIYGSRGFLQYQFVVPSSASAIVSKIFGELRSSGSSSFLAVLKVLGDRSSNGLLSFPRPGLTLAVDIPLASKEVFNLLDRFDEYVAEAGGAVYPAKDARMRPASFKKFFPRWQEFKASVDPKFSSDFARRVFQ